MSKTVIVNMLKEDPALSIKEVSRRLGVTRNVVRETIKNFHRLTHVKVLLDTVVTLAERLFPEEPTRAFSTSQLNALNALQKEVDEFGI